MCPLFKFFRSGLLLAFVLCLVSFGTTASDVESDFGESAMTVAAHPLAAEAGDIIISRGGNAVDAAVATAMALNVVEPHASGIGGGGFMLIYLAEEDEFITLDYQTQGPASLTPDMIIHDDPDPQERNRRRRVGHQASLIPGQLAGLEEALKKYGTMTWEEVLEPAIKLAEEGFPIGDDIHQAVMNNYDLILDNDAMREIFLYEDLPYERGDILKQPDLADTFHLIAEQGAEVFYEGEIAEKIAAEMEEKGGYITLEDLKNYEVIHREPVSTNYRGLDLFTMPPPSTGGLVLLQALNILEGYNLDEVDYTADIIPHLWTHAQRHANNNRLRFVADPDFVPQPIPIEGMLDKDYAEALRLQIRLKRRNPISSIEPEDFVDGNPAGNTTHFSVADGDGNIVSSTNTIVYFFGSKVAIEGTGIVMNNAMTSFWYVPDTLNEIQPGKRPRSNMAPTIVFRDEDPYLVLGSPASSRIPAAMGCLLINMVDQGLSLEEAMVQPRIHSIGATTQIEGGFPELTYERLERIGHNLTIRDELDLYFGGIHAIEFTEDGLLGVADPRRGGSAVGH